MTPGSAGRASRPTRSDELAEGPGAVSSVAGPTGQVPQPHFPLPFHLRPCPVAGFFCSDGADVTLSFTSVSCAVVPRPRRPRSRQPRRAGSPARRGSGCRCRSCRGWASDPRTRRCGRWRRRSGPGRRRAAGPAAVRTTAFTCRAGWNDVVSRKAVMPARYWTRKGAKRD